MRKNISKIGAFLSAFIALIFVVSATLSAFPAITLAAVNTRGTMVISSGNSQNWAGYFAANNMNGVSDNGVFSGVTGSWVVPTAIAPASTTSADTDGMSGDATWIGIGGITSSDLIQAGTDVIFNSLGQATYAAWYEALPGVSQNVPLAIHAGDLISVAVSEPATNEWYISFNDTTTGQSYATSLPYVSSHSSVEWIEEMPSMTTNGVISDSFIPLDNFGTMSFLGGTATENGVTVSIGSSGAQVLNMANANRQLLANVSGLGSNGESFTVTRTDVASTVSPDIPAVSSTIPSIHEPDGRDGLTIHVVPVIEPATQVVSEASSGQSQGGQTVWVLTINPNGTSTGQATEPAISGQNFTIQQLTSAEVQALMQQQMQQIDEMLSSFGMRFGRVKSKK